MSVSDDKIVSWQAVIQDRIDQLHPVGSDREFFFHDLFTETEWQEITEGGTYASQLSYAFAKRLHGYPDATDPIFWRAQSRMVLGETDGKSGPYFARIED